MENNPKRRKRKKKKEKYKCTNSMFVSQDTGQHQGCISDSSDPFICYFLPDFPLDHSPPSLHTINHI